MFPVLFSRRGIAAAGTMFVLAAALLPTAALAAKSTTHWVNDDKTPVAMPGKSCDRPGYNTIQAAVDAAAAGDTVKVCKGTYAGAVINKALKLDGDGAVINSGPYSHPGAFRAGFLLNPDRSGSWCHGTYTPPWAGVSRPE